MWLKFASFAHQRSCKSRIRKIRQVSFLFLAYTPQANICLHNIFLEIEQERIFGLWLDIQCVTECPEEEKTHIGHHVSAPIFGSAFFKLAD